MKILVTGGGGFLGTHVVRALKARGISEKDILAPRSSQYDFLDRNVCEKLVSGIDLVIHLAGLTGGGKLHRERPGEVFYVNALMGIQLMEVARLAGIKKFITAGSAAEYPVGAPLPLSEKDLWSGFPEASHAPYAIAKRALLMQGRAYHDQYRFNAVHLLFTNIYGPFAKPNSGVIPAFIERLSDAKAEDKRSITLTGNEWSTRDFLYVEDAADAVMKAIDSYDSPEPVNVGSGREVAIGEIARVLVKLIGFGGKVAFSSGGIVTRRVLDVSLAEHEFGFRATTGLEAGLRKTVEWYNGEHVE